MGRRIQVIASLAFGVALSLGGSLAYAATDQYYGRWTLSDEKPVYSSKGISYKTIDIAPCGKDFCGVSVGEDSACGTTLFRLPTTPSTDEVFAGHGKWGKVEKTLQLNFAMMEDDQPYLYVALGSDDMDITGREGSIPTFDAEYRLEGEAACTAE